MDQSISEQTPTKLQLTSQLNKLYRQEMTHVSKSKHTDSSAIPQEIKDTVRLEKTTKHQIPSYLPQRTTMLR
jgi:hypothetical protein